MRVITGKAKGRRLKTPRSEKIRPALDQVKEAIFNILFDVKGYNVLDLFAGTGSIGIEALSRGASSVTFVDNFVSAVVTIRKNIDLCGFSDCAWIMKAPVSAAIVRLGKMGKTFDLIFVDPPYLKNFVNPTLNLLAKSPIVKPLTLIIVEHHPKEPIRAPEGLFLLDERQYGQTAVSFLKKREL